MKKTTIFTILLIVLAVQGYTQENTPHKFTPLKEFPNKEAFIQANFTFQNKQFHNKKFSSLTDKISKERPFYFYLVEYKNTLIPRVFIYFYTPRELKNIIKKEEKTLGVIVEINDYINTRVNIDLYQELKNIGTNTLIKWDEKKYRNIFDKIIIQNVYNDPMFNEVKWALENPGKPYKSPYF